MIIKEGKSYVMANGAKCGPMSEFNGDAFIQRPADGFVWEPNGKNRYANGRAADASYDLVAEWVDAPPRNEDPTPQCDLGNHVRGSNDICVVCGATPEQVNEQARVAMTGIADSLDAAFPLVDNPANATGTAQMLKDYPGPKIAEALTNERKNTHGDWTEQAQLARELKETVRLSPNWKTLKSYQAEALDMLLVKVSRICSGDPNEPDHWLDIQGYAHLGMGGHKSA